MSTVRLSVGNSSYSISSSNTTGGTGYTSANGLYMEFVGGWTSESDTSVQVMVPYYFVENGATKDYWFKVKNPSGTTSNLISLNKNTNRTFTPNWTLSWAKTHSAQTGVDKPWYIYWYTDSAGKNLDRTWTIHIYGDISAKPSYKVSYSANGGSSTPAAQTKWYGENLTLASAISRVNGTPNPASYTITLNHNYSGSTNGTLTASRTTKYTFEKWKSSANNTLYNAATSYAIPNSAQTMTAQWNNSNSGTTTTSSVTLTSPTRGGYTFGGWGSSTTATSPASVGGVTLNGGAKITPTQSATYYAIWKRTITYNGNAPSGVSVTGVPAAATSVASSSTTIASGSGNTPARTGYLFKGWATTSSAKTAEYQPGGSYAANKPNVTLYAVWQSTVVVGSLVSIRCNQSGTPDDEGTYALLTLPWSTDSTASDTPTASFSITGEDGNPITVSNLSLSGHSGTISKLVAGFDTEKQYDIAITVSEATKGGSATARDSLSRAYFTMDVLGDAYYDYETNTGPRPGHGIAFGMPAKEEGMHVGYLIMRNSPTLGNSGSSSCFVIQDPENFPSSQGTSSINLYGDLLAMRQGSFGRAHIRAVALTSGLQGIQLETTRTDSSNNTVNHGAQLLIDGSGNRSVLLSDPTAWRNGLGASSGIWPVAQGGTGISNFFTVKYANGSTTSVSSSPSSYPRLASISLEAGTWLIVVGCYSASGTGSRVWAFSNATSMSSVPGRGNTVQAYAATVNSLYLPLIWTVSPSATTTYYVYGWQNTGSALNMSAYVIARKMS